MSQNQQILKHLKSGKSLTPLEALKRFGCWRLSGRILELRQQGWPVVTRTVRRGGKAYASYRMAYSGRWRAFYNPSALPVVSSSASKPGASRGAVSGFASYRMKA